jgi:hypothetical protein
MVVTPIYDVIAGSLKKNCDNEHKKTYDDFNEFFWSPVCLRFKTHDSAEDHEAGYFIVGLFCYICSFLLFVWLFFFTYALLAVVYVLHVEDRSFNTLRL